ncbi:MFS transporter [Streptomyces sp. NPDC101225]|uniref:MFS transporter n=1 Tax=Streptomyces sp. NPDC101225 TaxID=3366135 RepID=UPI00382EF819
MVSSPAQPLSTTHAGTDASRHRTGTLVAGCLAVCLAQIGLVLPAAINGVVQRSLQTSGAELTWVSDAFMVPAAVLALTFGVLGDLYGRKKLLVYGALTAMAGYVVSATAHTPGQLITGQALSGLGAAALFPASLAVVTARTTSPAARARGLASWTTALSMGAFIAPLLSGAVVEHASFRWAFAAVGVIAFVTAATTWFFAAESRAPEGRALDWPGQITVALSLLCLLYGIIQGPSDGWGSAPVSLALAAAVVLLLAFVRLESRSATPMLRLELFRVPAFAASAAATVVGMFGFLGGAYDLSIRLGVIQHQSPLKAAVPFLVIQGITPFIWPLLVRLLHRTGPGSMLVTGFLALATAQLWLRAVPVDEHGLLPLLGPLVLNGLGFGLVVAALTAAAVNTVPQKYTGMASASTSLVRDLGQTLGPAIVGAVALSMAADRITSGLSGAGLTAAEHGTATAVLAGGGPIALHSAQLGPLSAKIAPLTERALSDGYNAGLLLTAIACLTAAAVSGVFIGFKHPANQTSEPIEH